MTNTSLTKVYSSGSNGHMGRGSRPVTVDGKPLADVEGIGFTWGYNGKRDYNLAHSIMANYFDDPNVSNALWRLFYDDVISKYRPEDEWDITGQMISEWIYGLFPDSQSEEDTVQEEASFPEQDRRKQSEEPQVAAASRPLYNEQTYHSKPQVEVSEPEDEDEDDFDDVDDDMEDEFE